MNQTLAWLGLSKVEDLCHKQIETLLQIYKTPEKIIQASNAELKKYGLTEKQSQQITEISEEQLRTRNTAIKKRKCVFYHNRRREIP